MSKTILIWLWHSPSDNLKAAPQTKIENWWRTSNGSWNLFSPCEAMRVLPTGIRLAAGANFYIPEIPALID